MPWSTNIFMAETKPMRKPLEKAFLGSVASSSTSLIHHPYCTILLVTTLTHTLATRTPICRGTTQNTRNVHGPQQGQQSEVVPYRTPVLFMAPEPLQSGAVHCGTPLVPWFWPHFTGQRIWHGPRWTPKTKPEGNPRMVCYKSHIAWPMTDLKG